MTKYVINGGKTLNGEVTISGAKNAAVAIVPAALLADGPVRLENVPKIIDVTLQMEIMRELGAQIRQINATTVEIQNTQNPSLKPHELERKLREMSVEVTEFDDAVLVRREGKLTKTNIKTLPYPGFPTDMQPQMTTALCLAEGTSIITEGIWGSRYRYTEELTRMGANIHVDGAIAVVEGVRELNGAPVRAHDLRAGAAMVIAGLAAKGVTEVEQVQNIERGYETLVEKFVALGADMYRSEIPESAENK